MRRIVTISLVVAGLVLTSVGASASPRVWVRGPKAQAGMIGHVLDDFAGADQIQVLVRRCANVRDETGCTRMSPRLRSAIEAAANASITWVHRMWPHAGVYWVLSPFTWNGDKARFRHAWRDPAPSGCTGGGKAIFTLTDGSWGQTGGIGYEGCP